METIEIKPMTSIEDAVNLVLHTSKQSESRVVADFNDFIIDSKNSYDKNLDLYWAYMGRADCNVNWEQRRYEIAKTMLPFCVREYTTEFPNIKVNLIAKSSANYAVYFADALINELKKEQDNENNLFQR